jgi:hypothetical protein
MIIPLEQPSEVEEVLSSLGDQKQAITNLTIRDNDFETAFLTLLADSQSNEVES